MFFSNQSKELSGVYPMKRSELVSQVYDQSKKLKKEEVEKAVSLVLNEIIRGVNEGGRVELRGFGVFFPRARRARKGRNPKTGEPVSVSARRVLFFKAGLDILQRLNGKKAERGWGNGR